MDLRFRSPAAARPWLARLVGAACVLALTALALTGPAHPCWAAPQPYGLADLLRLERFTGIRVSPDHRRVAVALEGRYDRASTYASEDETDLALGRTALLDLGEPRPRLIWLKHPPRVGVTPGLFSPSGARLALLAFRNGALREGMADRQGRVRVFDLQPDLRPLGRGEQWLNERTLLLLSPARQLPPADLAGGGATFRRMRTLWMEKTRGRTSSLSILGAGAFADLGHAATNRLVSLDVATGRWRVLARGDFDDFELSPDHHQVALLARTGETTPPPAPVLVASEDGSWRELRVLDIASGRIASPTRRMDILPGLLAWNATSTQLLAFARSDPQRPWEDGRFIKVGALGEQSCLDLGEGRRPAIARAGGERRAIVEGAWLDGRPLLWIEDAASHRTDWLLLTAAGPKALTAALTETPAALVASSPHEAIVTGSDDAWSLRASGATRLISGRAMEALVARAPGRHLRPPVGEPEDTAHLWLSFERGGARMASSAERSNTTPAVPEQEQLLTAFGPSALTWATMGDGIGVLRLYQTAGHRDLLRINSFLKARTTVTPVRLTHRSADGAPRVDWLFLPVSDASRAPLLVLPYPGAEYASPPAAGGPGFFELIAAPQVLAVHGYAVLIPSLDRPPEQRGAEGVAEEIAAAVDAAQASGRVSPTCAALFGHSFGGYGALIAAEASPRYAAVVAASAAIDLATIASSLMPQWRAFPSLRPSLPFTQGWSERGQANLQTLAGRDLQIFDQASPFAHVDALSTPTLLIQGDEDFFGVDQAETLFGALRRRGRDAQLVIAAGEEHVVESPANVRALYAVIFRFLDQAFDRCASGTGRSNESLSSNAAPTPPAPPLP